MLLELLLLPLLSTTFTSLSGNKRGDDAMQCNVIGEERGLAGSRRWKGTAVHDQRQSLVISVERGLAM